MGNTGDFGVPSLLLVRLLLALSLSLFRAGRLPFHYRRTKPRPAAAASSVPSPIWGLMLISFIIEQLVY